MFKILVLSLALIFTACQKSSDDSKGTESNQSQMGQKLFENQSQGAANSTELTGLWELGTETTEDGAGRVTARLQIASDHVIAAVKCEFIGENSAYKVAYVGAESSLEYTKDKITFFDRMEQSVTLQNRNRCLLNFPAVRMSYSISAGQLSLCGSDKCLVLNKIAD